MFDEFEDREFEDTLLLLFLKGTPGISALAQCKPNATKAVVTNSAETKSILENNMWIRKKMLELINS